jgi:hypothetical protein
MKKLLIPIISFCVLLFLVSCSKNDEKKGAFSYMDENGEKYRDMATTHMKKFVRDETGLVDTIKVEGKKMYVKFKVQLEDYNYKDFAKRCAIEYNKYKKQTLGYTGVVVYCITDSGTIAHAIAQ